MTEYEDWYMSMAFIITDFVVNGGGSYDSTVIELVKFALVRCEKSIVEEKINREEDVKSKEDVK